MTRSHIRRSGKFSLQIRGSTQQIWHDCASRAPGPGYSIAMNATRCLYMPNKQGMLVPCAARVCWWPQRHPYPLSCSCR